MNRRIIKEVRLLFWPWCGVALAALVPLLSVALHDFYPLTSMVCSLSLFVGIPFLCAFSLGAEFQQRTVPMLLAQPVGRKQIWTEKQTVLVIALLILLPLYYYCWQGRNDLNGNSLTLLVAWLLATVSSTTFWTLQTRSTLGGMALGQVVQFGFAAVLSYIFLRIFGPQPSAQALHLSEAIGAAILLGYVILMLWLGHRQLARFQATEGLVGEDLLMAGPRLTPSVIAQLLHCRPTNPTLNLIRKELRLLRPLWLIVLLFLACWVCLVIFVRLTPETDYWGEWRRALPAIVLGFYVPLAVILAGCLSLGEERSAGTHAWHLTLPVSVRRQWFVKLATALIAGVFSAMVIPYLAVCAGQFLLGSPFNKWDPSMEISLEALVPLILLIFASFPAFWCASAVNGTARAALWVLPVLAAVTAVGVFGGWVASKTSGTVGLLVTWVVAHNQINPTKLNPTQFVGRYGLLICVLPALMVGMVQSRRLFRTQLSDSILSVVRRLIPLALTAFISVWLLWTVILTAQNQRFSHLVVEARSAIEKISMASPALNPTHPLELTIEDLQQAVPMSVGTQLWLRGTRITVTQYSTKQSNWYTTTFHFPDGSEFTTEPFSSSLH